jgi:tetratricopeptide (TPR) repeat protein
LLTPQAILGRLEKSLAFLAVGSRDLPARQQTLRGAIAWSYDLLDPPTQRLFRMFSRFAGGGTLEQLEAVCGAVCGDDLDVLASLQTLVEHSLVRQREVAGEPHFFMLQTIREYGTERLDESPDAEAVRRRHAETFLALCERAAPELLGAGRKQELDRLETAIDNLRGAVDWAVGAGAGDIARRFAAALWRFWQMRGHLQEGRSAVDRILTLPAGPDSIELAAAFEAAGGIAYWQGDMPAAGIFYQRALEICRRLGDERAIANACYNLSFTYFVTQNLDSARTEALLDEALALYRKLGDQAGVAKALWATSSFQDQKGNRQAAREALEESVPMFRVLGDSFGLGWALHGTALNELADKNFAAARAAMEEAIQIFAPAGDLSAITLILDDFARLESAVGNVERAVRLTGAAAALRKQSGTDLATLVNQVYGHSDAADRLPPAAVEAALKEGADMSCQVAVSYALSPNDKR